MRTLIPKTQVMNIHIIGWGGETKSSLIGCMQMSSYWGSGTAVGKIISLPAQVEFALHNILECIFRMAYTTALYFYGLFHVLALQFLIIILLFVFVHIFAFLLHMKLILLLDK